MIPREQTSQPLDRYIDRFLFADGWRVTNSVTNGSLHEVTITKGTEPGLGATVTRSAGGAGEATFKACSSARELALATT
jgi:hypothetical protein